MENQIQCTQDYVGYIKCGEILKSPAQSFQNAIILKCFQCTDVHYFLESFIAHIEEHFKDVLLFEEQDNKSQYGTTHVDEMESERVDIDNVAVKLEEIVDPLFPIKIETDEENSKEKYKDEIQNSNSSIKEFDMDQLEELEDVYDSADEFHPEVSETDEDEIIKKPKNKRKKCDKDEHKLINSEMDKVEVTKDSLNKRKGKLSPIVENFMKSKTKVLSLIEFYKNQPDLWNKYSPFYRLRDKRKQFFEEITQNINNKYSLQLSWNQTAEIISHICGKHRDDFKRIQGQQTLKKKTKKNVKKTGKYEKKSNKKVKSCWFFDHLNFLRSKITVRLQSLDTSLPELTSEEIIKIVEIYQRFPHLWNTYLIEYICSNKRRDAFVEMLKALETEMNIKISTISLEQYIHTIHNYFSREKRQRLEANLRNSPINNASPYYENMIFLEDHEGPFSCPDCNGVYTKSLCFRVHKSQHDGSIPLICSQCKQEFKSVASYTTHAKRHLEDLQFVCKECNMKFLRHSDLKIHLLTHTDARPYCCEICGASYRQSNSFRKHQRRHENRFSHTCHICSKGYYTKYRYIDHMNSHMNIRSYVCKICGKGFITSRALKTHAVTHEDARNHACNLCGKTFKLKIGVLQHMRTHGSKVETDDRRKII